MKKLKATHRLAATQPANENKSTMAADIVRWALAGIFVVMTIAFLTVPYALSTHPGDATVKTATGPHLT